MFSARLTILRGFINLQLSPSLGQKNQHKYKYRNYSRLHKIYNRCPNKHSYNYIDITQWVTYITQSYMTGATEHYIYLMITYCVYTHNHHRQHCLLNYCRYYCLSQSKCLDSQRNILTNNSCLQLFMAVHFLIIFTNKVIQQLRSSWSLLHHLLTKLSAIFFITKPYLVL